MYMCWCAQNNLVAKRGLGSESDDQVYDVALTDSFRKYFSGILLSSRSDVGILHVYIYVCVCTSYSNVLYCMHCNVYKVFLYY